MNNCIGIINLDENEQKTTELTRHRPLASLPIAGRYRVVDFILSNMKVMTRTAHPSPFEILMEGQR